MATLTLAQASEGGGRRGRVFAAAVFAVIGAAAADPVTAPRLAAAVGPATPLRAVTITLALEAHARRGEMAANRVGVSRTAKVGDEIVGTVGAGTLKSRDICDVQAAPPDTLYMTWRVQTTVRSADSEWVHLDLAWTRTTAGTGVTAEGATTVRIAPGRSHLIDILGTDPQEERMCSHVALRVTADRSNPVTGELLVHRVWLVHEQGGVRTVSDPVEAIGTAGESVPFRFRPLRWNAAGSMVGKAPGLQIDLDILGTINTESLPDGQLESMLDVRREIRFGPYSSMGSGKMVMAGRTGEAGEVELPPSGGLGLLPADAVPPGPLAHGFSRRGNRIRIDFSEFFAGSRTSLVISVERLR
jgi:hypothetical protein